MSIALQALAPEHIPQILDACADWHELAHSTSPSLLATLQHDARHYLVDAFVHKFV